MIMTGGKPRSIRRKSVSCSIAAFSTVSLHALSCDRTRVVVVKSHATGFYFTYDIASDLASGRLV